jgi:hypothetical protein
MMQYVEEGSILTLQEYAEVSRRKIMFATKSLLGGEDIFVRSSVRSRIIGLIGQATDVRQFFLFLRHEKIECIYIYVSRDVHIWQCRPRIC